MAEETSFEQSRKDAIDALNSNTLETFVLTVGDTDEDKGGFSSFWNARRDDEKEQGVAFLNLISGAIVTYARDAKRLSDGKDAKTEDVLNEIANRVQHLSDR